MKTRKGQVENLPNELENKRSIAALLIKRHGRKSSDPRAPGGTYLKKLSAVVNKRALTEVEIEAVLDICRRRGILKT